MSKYNDIYGLNIKQLVGKTCFVSYIIQSGVPDAPEKIWMKGTVEDIDEQTVTVECWTPFKKEKMNRYKLRHEEVEILT